MSTLQGQDDMAVCVLGCRVGSAALTRRAQGAAQVFSGERAAIVVACGGRTWDGVCEADELARLLQQNGVPGDKIIRERESHDTFENAAEAAQLLTNKPVILVTCSWHLPRARLLFQRVGVRVIRGIGILPPKPSLLSRAWWTLRERVSTWKDLQR